MIVLSVWALFREFQAITFDEEFSELVGLPAEGLAHYLMALISLAVVVLIQVVGVLLSIALLSIPAATARHWTRNLGPTMVLATLSKRRQRDLGAFLLLLDFLGPQLGTPHRSLGHSVRFLHLLRQLRGRGEKNLTQFELSPDQGMV